MFGIKIGVVITVAPIVGAIAWLMNLPETWTFALIGPCGLGVATLLDGLDGATLVAPEAQRTSRGNRAPNARRAPEPPPHQPGQSEEA
jgi:hypothetical protein